MHKAKIYIHSINYAIKDFMLKTANAKCVRRTDSWTTNKVIPMWRFASLMPQSKIRCPIQLDSLIQVSLTLQIIDLTDN